MPSSQIKTCPIKSANCVRLVTLTRTHLDGRSSEACWFDVALLCADSRRTQRKHWVHIVHTEETWYSCSQQRTGTTVAHREHSQIHSLLTQINTIHTFFSWCYLGVSVMNAQIKYVKYTGHTLMIINLLLYIETLHFFLLMTEVMSLQKQSVPALLRIMDYVQFRTG